MDLQVAAVDPVVVGDHQLRQLHVLVLDGLHRAVERGDDEVEAAERILLERLEVILVVQPCLWHQPNLPLT